ncbi:MAG: 3-oxo-tetronate 4-phosphate decarboxylase [Rhodospirillaceae bacterium]|nr:3-oxo-tetronate 4-phosphate decarboxylase [Rhodospirillaceae bacterium]
MSDANVREAIARFGRSLFERRLTFGSTGNISVRTADGWLVTPTGSSLGRLDPAALTTIDATGRVLSGNPPTKELALHLAMYRERPAASAVVHLHSTHSVAVSCLADVDPDNVLPPITAYYVMRVGRLPLVPYHPPGDATLVDAVRLRASKHAAILMANHGPIVAGRSLEAAIDATEELEETARLFLLLRGERARWLSDDQVADLQRRFPAD